MYRLVFFLLGLLSGLPLIGQESGQSSDSATAVPDVFRMRGSENPIDVSKIKRSRITTGFQYDSVGNIVGIDKDIPSSRFRPLRRFSSPGIESYFPDSYFHPKNPDAPDEINRPLVGDSGGTQSAPLRRPGNFYARPNVNAMLEEAFAPGATDANAVAPAAAPGKPDSQRWFRDPGSIRQGVRPLLPQSAPAPDPSQTPGAAPGGAALPLSSTDALPPIAVPDSPPSSAAPSPADVRRFQRQFEERLEAGLIGHASIHALSPIQVSVSGTTATVRGVVADRQSRLAVGRQLLADPNIKQVNNLTTVLSDDPAKRPEPVDAK